MAVLRLSVPQEERETKTHFAIITKIGFWASSAKDTQYGKGRVQDGSAKP